MSNKEWDKISYAQSQSLQRQPSHPPDVIDAIDEMIDDLEYHSDPSAVISVETAISMLLDIKTALLPF